MRMFLLPLLLLASLLAACTTVSLSPAPVESKNFNPLVNPTGQPPAPPAGAASSAGPNAAYAGQPGYYTVQPGDTVRRIALQFGQDWHNIARWNNLGDANVIEVGQVLRVAPPGSNAGVAAASPASPQTFPSAPTGSQVAQAYPLAPVPAPTPAPAPAATPSAAKPAAAATHVLPTPGPATTAVTPPKAVADNGGLAWSWPAQGKVIQGYNGTTSKGLDIGGKQGEPILAAANGKVVYAGNELRGFGNLVIIKHNADYISVYAHNEKLLVKDGQDIKRGQQIALMGSSDAPRVELHFEVRLRGKPIDPTQVLPPR